MIATRTMWQSSVSTSAGPFRNQQVRELLGMVNAHDSGQAGCLAHCLRLGGVGVLFCVMVLSSRDWANRSQSSERLEAGGNLQANKRSRDDTCGQAGAFVDGVKGHGPGGVHGDPHMEAALMSTEGRLYLDPDQGSLSTQRQWAGINLTTNKRCREDAHVLSQNTDAGAEQHGARQAHTGMGIQTANVAELIQRHQRALALARSNAPSPCRMPLLSTQQPTWAKSLVQGALAEYQNGRHSLPALVRLCCASWSAEAIPDPIVAAQQHEDLSSAVQASNSSAPAPAGHPLQPLFQNSQDLAAGHAVDYGLIVHCNFTLPSHVQPCSCGLCSKQGIIVLSSDSGFVIEGRFKAGLPEGGDVQVELQYVTIYERTGGTIQNRAASDQWVVKQLGAISAAYFCTVVAAKELESSRQAAVAMKRGMPFICSTAGTFRTYIRAEVNCIGPQGAHAFHVYSPEVYVNDSRQLRGMSKQQQSSNKGSV